MDIPAQFWAPEKGYKKDDIIRVDNFIMPADGSGERDENGDIIRKINSDNDEDIKTDHELLISTDAVVSEAELKDSQETVLGWSFLINKELSYSMNCMVRKSNVNSKLKDEYKTYLTESNGSIDVESSVGVGIGIRFMDSNDNELRPVDLRTTRRVIAGSEANHKEYYNISLDMDSGFIPEGAVTGYFVAFVYGHKSGGFVFKKPFVSNLSRFFYCSKDHLSSFNNGPTASDGSNFWTQDFLWRPSYGSKSDFVAINDQLKMGEGRDYVTNMAINALPLELNLSFKNRTDREARAIVHFLQEKSFAYESIFSLDYKGDRLLSSEVRSFPFKYTYPYKDDLRYTCTEFNHSIVHRNNNQVSAKFICNTQSTLSSVESHAGYNKRIDALIPIFIDKKTEFIKGEPIVLNTFSLEGENIVNEVKGNGVEKIEKYNEPNTSQVSGGKISFLEPQGLEEGNCVYIKIEELTGSIFNIGNTKIIKKISDTEFVFSPILEEGLDSEINKNISIKKLAGCPQDCLFNKVLLPEGVNKIESDAKDPLTGEVRKRQVYLKNYRRLQIDSEIDSDTTSIQFTPMENFTLDAEDDFWLLISAVGGRSSIYLKDPNQIPKYPWLKVRSFDHKPSFTFSLKQTPDHIQTNFIKYYNKKYKKQINSNLSTFNLVFEKRSDEEAAEILQFLESHLGYKKFRFTMPGPYLEDGSALTSQTRPYMSTFYCPSWGHDIVYKNNHTISVTFIESATSIEEDLRSVFGIGDENEDKPCFGAEIHNPVTAHELCTYSSILQAARGVGFDLSDGGQESLTAKSKAVDLVFIVDTTGSMTNRHLSVGGEKISKYRMAIDIILKMITAHDDYVMPGTKSFGGVYDAPELTFGSKSGNDTVPPWPANNTALNSLIGELYDPLKELNDLLKDNNYNLSNLDRFKIKIDEKRVNLGFILMADPRQVIQDVSDYPNSFDKIDSYQKVDIANPGWQLMEDSPRAVSQALAQFYNSPRAEHVTDRIVIMLSDGVFTSADASKPGNDYSSYRSQYTLDMCAQLRKGGELAKRRPADSVLKKYGYQSQTPYEKLESYRYKQKDDGGSRYNNPDSGKDNPSWYEEELPTVFMFAQVGSAGALSKYAPNYVYDYSGPAPYLDIPAKNLQFFFPITQGGDPSGEVTRMMDLIKVVEMVTSDSGYQNIFSIVLYNCGPHEVRLLNTIVNVESESEPMRWTTDILKQGIVSGGNNSELTYINESDSIDSIKKGHGGQYFDDPNNQDLFSDQNKKSNILWESFNTKYEVYREGRIFEVENGWNTPEGQFEVNSDNEEVIISDSNEAIITDIQPGPHRTKGVLNDGVARKGMPVRKFRSNSGLEIIDYNIGNVIQENSYQGDYSHLPTIKPGEKLDLFFGVKVGSLGNFSEKVQLVVNSDDGTIKKMDGYANYEFNVGMPVQNKSNFNVPFSYTGDYAVSFLDKRYYGEGDRSATFERDTEVRSADMASLFLEGDWDISVFAITAEDNCKNGQLDEARLIVGESGEEKVYRNLNSIGVIVVIKQIQGQLKYLIKSTTESEYSGEYLSSSEIYNFVKNVSMQGEYSSFNKLTSDWILEKDFLPMKDGGFNIKIETGHSKSGDCYGGIHSGGSVVSYKRASL